MGNERFSFVHAEIVRLVRAGSGIEKSECRATEAEGGPASRTKRSLRQGPEMKGAQKQAALKSLKRAENVRRHAHRRPARFRVTFHCSKCLTLGDAYKTGFRQSA